MKKRKYLHRLIAVLVLMLIFPIVLFFDFFWKNSYEQMKQVNEEFYEKALESYTDLFDRKVQELKQFAIKLSVESRGAESMLRNGQEALAENTYYAYMAIRELEEKYARKDVSDWGIYFYDIDKIITPEHAYTAEQFIYKYTAKGMEDVSCAGFFSDENYAISDMLFDTMNESQYYNGYLLVGVWTRIGLKNDRVLVFYLLSPQDIENSLPIVGGEGIAYCLFDEKREKILLAWGEELTDNGRILDPEEWNNASNNRKKVLYNMESYYGQLSVKAYILQDSLQNNIINYVIDMKTLLVCTVVILLIVCCAALYIAYKPIYDLVHDLDDSDDNEFDMIRRIMNDKDSRIAEQEMLTMDLLIKHLIYGVHISEKCIKQLGIEEYMHYYCVFLIEGHILANSEAERLCNELEKSSIMRIFVTEWLAENSSIVIVFSKDKDIAGLRERLAKWMEEDYVDDCCLYMGKVFDELDNIQLSFRSCVQQMKKGNDKDQKENLDTKTLTPREEQQKRMKEEILAYLEAHYTDSNLSQVQVADMFRISNYTLSRLFKSQVGVGFVEYLTAKRLEYAKELLLTTSYAVREVALMSGFTSESYFSRTFKLYEGVSPSSYRTK